MSTRPTPPSASPPRAVIGGAGKSAAANMRKPQFGAKSVGSFVPRLTRQAFEKYGFSTATLITDWATIVGADLAKWTEPERLRWPKAVSVRADSVDEPDQGRPGAMLILRVDPGRALDIQYKARQITERINAYFGYRAVADLRLVQAPLTSAANLAPRVTPPAARQMPPPAAINTVTDDSLRAALEQMASGLANRGSANSGAR
ncbi:MAG: DUF721 domain-containing protein [Hyphomicrobiaceae bacterium]